MRRRVIHGPVLLQSVCASLLLLMLLASCGSKKQNRLATASSPYLQEHADNPVDWYEWGEEALQKAAKENKPLLISVGYSACHWCHVMERESFLDTAVARLMNENFVCIKVDREERPDIDNVYTNACQLLTGGSGWPLNAFALPDGKPFFAGTYYTKDTWTSLLKNIATAYQKQNKKIVLQAWALANGIAKLEVPSLQDSSESNLETAISFTVFDSVYQQLDLRNGGLKGSPKFPSPPLLEYLLQHAFLAKDGRALNAVKNTLTQMALGGIYDQIGGGFSRYATDSLWRVPHFEKMLCDNGQLLSVYAHAYQLTGDDFFKTIVAETASFIEREMRSTNGAFYSSLNADTKAGEGSFYTWKVSDLKNIPAAVLQYYNLSPAGNWEGGKNILYASSAPEKFARQNNLDSARFFAQLQAAKEQLLRERNRRERPSVDDKILASWNAVALTGFLDGYAATGNEDYLKTALSTAAFLETKLMKSDGKLWRTWKDGKPSVDGFLEDYALCAKAFIRLYQLTFNKHWLDLAKSLAGYVQTHFFDPRSGLYFFNAANTEQNLIRKIDLADNALPSSNAVMADILYKLGVYFDKDEEVKRATAMTLKLQTRLTTTQAIHFSSWAAVAERLALGSDEVAVTGPQANEVNKKLQKFYLPASVILGSASKEDLPLLKGKQMAGQSLIYVCKNRSCKRPTTSVTEALKQLAR